MSATLVQVWGVRPYTPSGAKLKGDIIVIASIVGVVTRPIEANSVGELAVDFIATFPKNTGGGTAIADGTPVYWKAAGPYISVTASDGNLLGLTVGASLDADATQNVKAMNGGGGGGGKATLLTDSTTGSTATTTAAAGFGIETITIPLTSLATGLSTSAIDLLTTYTLGYKFKLLAFDFVTTIVGAGTNASQTFNLAIGSTATTGGSLNATLASTNTIGKITNASSITALNTGTASDTLSIKMAVSGTVFTSGSGYFVIKVQNMDTADAYAGLVNLLKAGGLMASA